MVMNKESVFRGIKSRRPKIEKIEDILGLPEVYVREGSAAHHEAVCELYEKLFEKKSIRGFKQGVIIYYLCDESGNRIFTDDDIDDEKINADLNDALEVDVSKVCATALTLNGFTDLWSLMDDRFKVPDESDKDSDKEDDDKDGDKPEEPKSINTQEEEVQATIKN